MDDDEGTMQFYDAEGKRVKAGDPSVNSQYLSKDPNRPDSDEQKAARAAADKALKSAPEKQAKTSSDEDK